MALVVETGSGDNANANSYADLAFIRAYNMARGRGALIGAWPDDTANANAILAMDAIEAREPDMQGNRTFADQPLSFPRTDVVLNGEWFDDETIPTILKNAQAELAWQVKSGVNLFPTVQGQQLKRRKIGPIEREFFGPADLPSIPAVDNWLNPLLSGVGFQLRVERV